MPQSGDRDGNTLGSRCPIRYPYVISVERKEKAKVRFWEKPEKLQSDLFVLHRGRLSIQGVIAMHSKFGAISNVWWPLRRRYITEADKITLASLAFTNSTFGFLHMLAERLETEGYGLNIRRRGINNQYYYQLYHLIIIYDDVVHAGIDRKLGAVKTKGAR